MHWNLSSDVPMSVVLCTGFVCGTTVICSGFHQKRLVSFRSLRYSRSRCLQILVTVFTDPAEPSLERGQVHHRRTRLRRRQGGVLRAMNHINVMVSFAAMTTLVMTTPVMTALTASLMAP
jgi:hypothetical protein